MGTSRARGIDLFDLLPEDGERRLMLAVLVDAIRILRKSGRCALPTRAYRIWARERAWIDTEDRSAPFSFTSVCEALGLDAGYVRRCALSFPGRASGFRLTRSHSRKRH